MTTHQHSKSNVNWSPPNESQIIDLTETEDKSFVFAKSASDEVKILLSLWIKISFCGLLEMTPQFIGKMFVGHIPNTNSGLLLSAVGLAQNYTNITAISIGWGLTSGLLILLPQTIGSNITNNLLRNYVQRVFWITLFALIISTILQIYSGDILCAILRYNKHNNNNAEICEYITMYCVYLIPFTYLTVWFTILQRIIQNLDYNSELLLIIFISNIMSPLWNYLLIYKTNLSYLGAALTMDITIFCMTILSAILLCYKGHSNIFKPMEFGQVLNCSKVWEYLSLAIPGLVQTCSAWWIGELITILAGFVNEPYIAVSSTVICYSLFEILLEFSVALGNTVNIRVGKYIGYGSIVYAKRVCRVTAFLDLIWALVVFFFLLIFKDLLPRIYTNDEEIIQMASKLMYFLVIICICYTFFRVLSGIYQGLGKPTFVAIIMFFAQDFIGLVLTLVFLFALNYKQYTDLGLYSIWSCAAFGYFLVIISILVSLVRNNETIWIQALNDSNDRIQDKRILTQTNANYGSISYGV